MSFGKLARKLNITPEDVTILSVIARMPDTGNDLIHFLPSCAAKDVANILMGDKRVTNMVAHEIAEHLQKWAEHHKK